MSQQAVIKSTYVERHRPAHFPSLPSRIVGHDQNENGPNLFGMRNFEKVPAVSQ